MFNKRIYNILVALFMSAAFIGFAFEQRLGGPFQVSQATLYFVAAIIWISPVIYRIVRRNSCEKKESHVG
jgi:hypothetical protein